MSLYSNEIYEILKKDDYSSAVFKDVLPRNLIHPLILLIIKKTIMKESIG